MRTPKSMAYVSKSLRKDGWEVVNWGYPSRQKMIEEHGEDLVYKLQSIAKDHPQEAISFVTHSMGGLVLRSALNHPDCPMEAKVGKAILLAPPNQGSWFARFLSRYSFARMVLGSHCGKQLMETAEGGFESLGAFPEGMSVLVIAGTRTFNPFIEGGNDGRVKVSETELSTPHNLQVMRVNHTWIMWNRKIVEAILDFLKTSG